MTNVADAARELAEHEPADVEQLRHHLIHEHGRALHELIGLPLAEVHDLEHFDDEMGLLDLRHSHD